jgi:NAD(P)-dependent dehydrogenase (short-subunit alcohol dehydrogenase family)
MSAFDGKVAIVTGAASGIGAALCSELARRGATVHAADREEAGLERLLAANRDRDLHGHPLDVADESAVEALLEKVSADGGRLDYLFNNAGIVVGGDFEQMDADTWRRIVDVNLWGVVHGTQHGYAVMRRQGFGHIVNTASTAGVLPVARSVAYATTKHAVVGLSVSLREEARRHGVNVSVVIPGLVDTNIFASATNVGGHDYAKAMDRVPFRQDHSGCGRRTHPRRCLAQPRVHHVPGVQPRSRRVAQAGARPDGPCHQRLKSQVCDVVDVGQLTRAFGSRERSVRRRERRQGGRGRAGWGLCHRPRSGRLQIGSCRRSAARSRRGADSSSPRHPRTSQRPSSARCASVPRFVDAHWSRP